MKLYRCGPAGGWGYFSLNPLFAIRHPLDEWELDKLRVEVTDATQRIEPAADWLRSWRQPDDPERLRIPGRYDPDRLEDLAQRLLAGELMVDEAIELAWDQAGAVPPPGTALMFRDYDDWITVYVHADDMVRNVRIRE